MMAFWSPEAVARASELDRDPHEFIRSAADLSASRLHRAGAMSIEQSRAWRDQLEAEATACLASGSRRRAAS
jgi:hypothetical protein